jgi:plasmid stabilization system protein ParE
VILLSSEAVSDVERVRSFLERLNPDAAKRALKRIWDALDMVEKLPSLGRPTEHPEIRQIVVLFGASGYIVRYKFLHEQGTLLVTRIWHSREAWE